MLDSISWALLSIYMDILNITLVFFVDLSAWKLFVVRERCWAGWCIEDIQKRKETGYTRSGVSVWIQRGGGCSSSNGYGVRQTIWTTLWRVPLLLQSLLGSQSKDMLSRECLDLASHLHVQVADLLAGNIAGHPYCRLACSCVQASNLYPWLDEFDWLISSDNWIRYH